MSIKFEKIESKYLKKIMNISVYIPDEYKNQELPILYFLHGRTGNENILHQLDIDQTADKLISNQIISPLIIVCPSMDNSRGINSSNKYQEIKGKYGIINKGLYENYLVKEVITYIEQKYRIINKRTFRYIGGISAGGYIALHIGLKYSNLFSKIGGHMPAIDMYFEDEDECYFENEQMWRKYDPLTLAQNYNGQNLKVFLDDGNQDEGKFYLACKKLYTILKSKNVEVENYVFKGKHDINYVLSNIESYLKFYNNGCINNS